MILPPSPSVSLPLGDGRRPRETRSEAREGDRIPRLDGSSSHRLVEREWDRSGTGIAVFAQVGHHTLLREIKPLGRRVQDALVRLVQDHPVDVVLQVKVRGLHGLHGLGLAGLK